MKNCLIFQPCGIGDIIWIQPIVDKFINMGYKVYHPVIDLYYDMVANQIKKDNLMWVKESDSFPLKEHYGLEHPHITDNELYIPISHSWKYLKNCSVMIGKYFFTNTPITNWHKNIQILRNFEKENRVFEVYGIDKTKPFTLSNMSYGTPPNSIKRNIAVPVKTNQHIEMSFEVDQKNNIQLFDWIGAIEMASEIFTVETSTCFLADMYAKTETLHMYERKPDNSPPIFYNLTNKIYRNPNWTYEII